MSYWKVKWGDIEKEFIKKIQVNADSPIKSYLETDESIFTFIRLKGQTLYAEISKKPLVSIDDFKMEFLNDSFELLENPLEEKPKTLVTKQEIQ